MKNKFQFETLKKEKKNNICSHIPPLCCRKHFKVNGIKTKRKRSKFALNL